MAKYVCQVFLLYWEGEEYLLRLFITVNMSQVVKNQVAQVIPNIKSHYKGRFVPMDNWHITTLFLGEVEEEKLPKLEKAMETVSQQIRPFRLSIEGIGAFPSMKKPNILWAGVKGDLQSFEKLYHQLIQAIQPLEIDFDAKPKFTPHLTLARKVVVQGDCEREQDITLQSDTWIVDSLELYQSTFVHQGVKYHRVLKTNFADE